MNRLLLAFVVLVTTSCVPPGAPVVSGAERDREKTAIDGVIDDWHDAAADADEKRYFAHLEDGAVFLGTDASERWDKAAFRRYAHRHFAKGKAWSFRSARRDVIVSDDARIAWFDEDLVTPNLGPARGSGVLRKGGDGVWRIAHYNLAITVPNDRFKAVKALLDGDAAPKPSSSAPQPARPSP
jgi:ketosteroid isomerase-like protein